MLFSLVIGVSGSMALGKTAKGLLGTWTLQETKCASGAAAPALEDKLAGKISTVLEITPTKILSKTKYTVKMNEANAEATLMNFEKIRQQILQIEDPFLRLKYMYELEVSRLQFITSLEKNKNGYTCESYKGAYYTAKDEQLELNNYYALSTCDEGQPKNEFKFRYEQKGDTLMLQNIPQEDGSDINPCPKFDSLMMIFTRTN